MIRISVLIAALLVPATAMAGELRTGGMAAIELRTFTEKSAHPGQHGTANLSGVLEPEVSYSFANGKQSLTLRPYLRLTPQPKV